MIRFSGTQVWFWDNVKVILICAEHFSSTQEELLISSLIFYWKSHCIFSSLMTLNIWFLLLSLDNLIDRFAHLAIAKLL